MRIALALCLLFAGPDLVRADCKPVKYTSSVSNATGGYLPVDGGLIVTAQGNVINSYGEANAINPGWRFVIGGKQITPTVVTLAPGLVLYRPPTGTLGKVKFVEGDDTRDLDFWTVSRVAKVPPAPEPRLVELATVEKRGQAIQELRVILENKPKHSAAYLIVYGVTKTGSVPQSFRSFSTRDPVHIVAGAHVTCDDGIPGEVMAKVGDEVQLAFVDPYGRMSAKSKTIKVTKDK